MGTLIVIIGFALYFVLYFTYGKYFRDKIFKSHEAPQTPAKRLSDKLDYMAANKHVLFGHHFAAIAGAGPIVGPALATAWGWLPALLWIWLGNVFIGAIHDYLALTASVRYDGRSVQFVAQDVIGKGAGKAFGIFILVIAILVVASFTDICAVQFIAGNGEVATAYLGICFAALIMGYLMYHTSLGILWSTVIGIILQLIAFAVGDAYGIKASRDVWTIVIFVYIVLASALPVNVLLQPRDYLNSFLLYAGLFLGALAAILTFKSFDSIPVAVFSPKILAGQPTPFWPTIPLILACGALSGLHGLIASGTTSKQLSDEKEGLYIAYGGMLTEGFLATIVVISIAAFGIEALGGADKVFKTGAVPRFNQSYGAMCNSAFSFLSPKFMAYFAAVWVSSFVMTTLDAVARLGRYILAELALPLKGKSGAYKLFANHWSGAIIIAAVGVYLGWGGGYTVLWPMYGGANQMIASVIMLMSVVWMKNRLGVKNIYPILIPALLLWFTVSVALIWYEIVVVPTFFKDMANIKNVTTGVIVGGLTILMLVLGGIIFRLFVKNYGAAAVPAEKAKVKATVTP